VTLAWQTFEKQGINAYLKKEICFGAKTDQKTPIGWADSWQPSCDFLADPDL